MLRKMLAAVALPLATLGIAATPVAAYAAIGTPHMSYHAHNVADGTCSGCVFYPAGGGWPVVLKL